MLQAPSTPTTPVSPLKAIQSMASTIGNNLAWWGNYITDFVADVAGENEPTDEEIAEQEQQRRVLAVESCAI